MMKLRPAFRFFNRTLCLCLCMALIVPSALGAPLDPPMALPTPTPEPTATVPAGPSLGPTEPSGTQDATQTPDAAPSASPQPPVQSSVTPVEPTPSASEPGSSAAPTDTDAPTVTPGPTDTDAPADTAAPTDTDTPIVTPGPTDTDTPIVTPGPTDTDAPADTATPTDTDAPIVTPRPTDTDAPIVTPRPTDTTAPTATPGPTDTTAPTNTPDPAWDETLCDHMTAQCTLAPACTIADCTHIGLDENSLVTALCPLGEWLFAAADRELEAKSKSKERSATIPMAVSLQSGVNILYRSGSYELSGGDGSSLLYVRGGTVASLSLAGVTLLTLNLQTGAVASLSFYGANAISTIAAPEATLTLNGKGSLTVQNLNCGSLTMAGGSLDLPSYVSSRNGRLPYAFPARGTTSATVDGEYFPYSQPGPDDKAHLWLPAPGFGLSYTHRIDGGKLIVISKPEEPVDTDECNLSVASPFEAVKGQAYRVVPGDAPQSRALNVNQPDVSLSLSGVGGDTYQPTITATQPVTLFLSQHNRLAALHSTAEVTLSGVGVLQLDSLNAPALKAPGALTIVCQGVGGGALASWQRLALSQQPAGDVTAVYGGKPLSLCLSQADPNAVYLPLPAPAPGYRYEAAFKGNRLIIEQVTGSASLTLLTDAGVTLPSGHYRLQSDGSTKGNLAIAAGANVLLTLDSVGSTGDLTIGENATVTLTLIGGNRFEGTLSLGANAKLLVEGEGALLAGGATGQRGCSTSLGGETSVTLKSGNQLPGCKLKPNTLFITGPANTGLANTPIVLKLGGEKPFNTVTDRAGYVTLWRSRTLDKVDAAVLSGSDTYAALITGGTGAPDALPEISGEKETNYGAVRFNAKGGKTLGIQYIISTSPVDMPDTYLAGALTAPMQNGECNIPGLRNGDVVTYRVYASAKEGAALAPDTADAFAFGELRSFTAQNVRGDFSLEKQTKTYDRKKFTLSSKLLPDGSGVAYFQDGKLLSAPPVDVGVYTAKVTVPSGNAKYLPGVYAVEIEILRVLVWIYPDFAYKTEKKKDPPFTFTYSDMLPGDEVTGFLIREQGEEYGNYAYLTDYLEAPDYYLLLIDPDLPDFFINWNPHRFMPYDPLARIDPIYDVLRFGDGFTVKIQLRTGNSLRIGDVYYGSPISDSVDGKERPFTPGLRLRGGHDQALLMMTAEPELNKDGGYQTDADGNRVVRGRTLTLSYAMLSNFHKQRIDYLSFGLEGVSVLLSLDELRSSEALSALMKENGVTRVGTNFHVTLEPVSSQVGLAQNESAATNALFSGSLMRVSVYLTNGGRRVDIPAALSGAQVMYDASGILAGPTGSAHGDKAPDVSEKVIGKPKVTQAPKQTAQTPEESAAIAGALGDGEATEELLEIAQQLLIEQMKSYGYHLACYTDGAPALDSRVIVPYTASESQSAMFTALMRTRPYIMAPFTRNGLYGLSAQNP